MHIRIVCMGHILFEQLFQFVFSERSLNFETLFNSYDTFVVYKLSNFGKYFQRKLTKAGLNKTKVSQVNNQSKR